MTKCINSTVQAGNGDRIMKTYNRSELTFLADECARQRNQKLCDCNCPKCVNNVSHYISDPKEAVLFQQVANIEYKNMQREKQELWDSMAARSDLGSLILSLTAALPAIIVFIVLLQQCVIPEQRANAERRRQQQQQQQQQQPRVDVDSVFNVYGGYSLARVVNWTNENIYDNSTWFTGDDDTDGIDCVDYAILFWSYCGGRSNPHVRLMRCTNARRNFDHLFIRWYGYDIEPTTGDPMAVWWGDKYRGASIWDVTTTCTEVPLYEGRPK